MKQQLTKSVGVRLTGEQHYKLVTECFRDNIRVSTYIREIIISHIKNLSK